MNTTLLTNCQIVSSEKISERNILIENSQIKYVSNTSEKMPADTIIDVQGKHVLPGIIDTHVHLRTPGAEHKEDWAHGTRAAAAGGITTVIDMPNTNPPTTTPELLDEKRKIAADQSRVNYGFFLGVNQEGTGNISLASNIAGVKVYLDPTTENQLITDKSKLKKIFNQKAHFALHAEGMSFKKALHILAETNNPVHLCHTSRAEEVELAREYKKSEMNLTIEVAPHHLFLLADDLPRLKGFGIMKPALGTKKDTKALWEGIIDGTVDSIATDHAPHTLKEKNSDTPPFGVPGLETSLPLMLNSVHEKKLTLEKIASLMSENPANIFNIRNKGKIAPGYDADLTVIDMNLTKKIKNSNLYTKCGWSPFDGLELTGWPIQTWVNGACIMENGKILNDNLKGKKIIFA